MNILSMPDGPGFSAASFGLVSATQVFQSPLSGQTQTLDLGWDFWQASYVLKPMKAQQAGPWKAFLTQLRGRSGRFYGFDPMAECGACGALGTSVKSVPASGTELAPSLTLAPALTLAPSGTVHPGWDYPTSLDLKLAYRVDRGDGRICVTGLPEGFDWSSGVNPNYDPDVPILCSGAYIQVCDELKMALTPLHLADCGGDCIDITPAMRGDCAAGVKVATSGASAVMRLVDDGQAQWSESPGGLYSISFSAVEAI